MIGYIRVRVEEGVQDFSMPMMSNAARNMDATRVSK
jgi:hypothetical protein